MRVTEYLSTEKYWHDPRFKKRKPNLFHNWETASGDNIYEPTGSGLWRQLNSYHSHKDGTCNQNHVERDTKVKRILISDDFVYFGGEGPRLPNEFCTGGEVEVLHSCRNYKVVKKENVILAFEEWVRSLDMGFQGIPWDWVKRRN